MLKLKKIYILLFLFFFVVSKDFAYSVITNVQTDMDDNGNTVAVWQDDFNTGYYSIVAAVLPAGGSWSIPVTLSGTNASHPKVAVNSSGNAVVIWTAYNSLVGYTSLYGADLTTLSSWSLPVQISENTEHVYDNYNVRLSNYNDLVITWSSFSFVTYNDTCRSMSDSFGSWSLPVIVSP